jgi:hypothetical protein
MKIPNMEYCASFLLSSKIFDRSRHNFFVVYDFSDGAQFATAKGLWTLRQLSAWS